MYGDAVAEASNRSGLPFITVLSNTNTAASVIVRSTEPIPVGLFLSSGLAKGFQFVKNFSLTYTFGDLSRLWSHASSGNTISTISVSIAQGVTSPPVLSCNWLQYDDIDPSQLMYPRCWDFNQITFQTQSQGSPLAAGASTQVSSQVINLDSIPKRVYIYCKRRQADETYLTSDVNARIDSCQVTWGGKQSLAQARSVDLWKMSVKNGSKQTWQQWSQYQGSVLCIEFGSDIPMLSQGDYIGKLGQSVFQVSLNITNTSSSAVTYDLVTLPVYAGLVVFSEQTPFTLYTGFQPEFIMNAEHLPRAAQYQLVNDAQVFGGYMGSGFFSRLWSGIKKVANPILNVGKTALKAAAAPALGVLKASLPGAVGDAVSSIAESVGLAPEQQQAQAGALMGAALMGAAMSGKGMKGKGMSTQKLAGQLLAGSKLGGNLSGGSISNKSLKKQLNIK